MTTNTTATIKTIAADFANWLCDTVEHKIAEGRSLGLSDGEIVSGAQSAILAFMASR